jgi:multidrug resistance efflux pump
MRISWGRGARGRWSVAALALALMIGYARYWKSSAESRLPGHSAAPEIPTVKVASGSVQATLRLTGSFAALKSAYLLAPRILGSRTGFNRGGDTNFGGPAGGAVGGGGDFNLVLVTLAKAGARVHEGDVVAQFDTQSQVQRLDDYRDTVVQLQNNIRSAIAALSATRETHDQQVRAAKADWDKALLDVKTTPLHVPIDIEKLKLAAEQAEATYKELESEGALVEESQRAQIRGNELNLAQAKIELERAEANVRKMTIKAPMDGFVVMASIVRNGEFGQVREGDQVNAGQPFLTVVDPSSMVLNASLNQVDAERLRLGMKAKIYLDAYPQATLPGTVVGIGAMAMTDPFRASYVGAIPVRIRLDGQDPRVLPDLTGSAEIVLADESGAIVAPRTAVFEENGAWFAFRRTPEGWEKVTVTVGLENGTSVALESGLRAGDEVALQRVW